MKDDDQLSTAIALHQNGDLDQAFAIYDELFQRDPTNAELAHLIGLIHAQKKNYLDATIYFQKAIAGDPNQAHYHNNIANAYQRLNQFDAALEHYQKVLAIDPNSAEGYNNIANLYLKKGDYALANEYYARAISIDPTYAEAYFNLANLCLKQNEISEAIQHLQMACYLYPDNSKALKLLADLYLQKEYLPEAEKMYEILLSIEPRNLEGLNNLGVTYSKLKKLELAAQCFTKVLLYNENHLEARNNLAALYLQEDRYDNAARNYAEILKQQPDDLEVHYNLGVAQMALGKLADAKAHFEKIIVNNPQHAHALANLAAVFVKEGRYEEALKYYEQAHLLLPDNQSIQYLLTALKHDKAPLRAPDVYIENVFDNYALTYDKHLRDGLHYQVPLLLQQALMKSWGESKKQVNILDLGCGTGLMGEAIAGFAKTVEGVDLSQKMLRMAEKRGIYSTLHRKEIHEFLQESQKKYDVILAADVFIYVGDLADIFNSVYQCLSENGLFAFTLEEQLSDGRGDYTLRATGRYAHSKKYIEDLITKCGFMCEYVESIVPRHDKGEPIKGLLYVLKRGLGANH